jgi:hypothetical protein
MRRSRLTALQLVQQALPQLSRTELEIVRATVLRLLGPEGRKVA